MAEEKHRKIFGSSLKRKTALKRTSCLRSKCPKDRKKAFSNFGKKKTLKPSKKLRQCSKKRAKRLRTEYYPIHKEFLARPENRYCWICIGRSIGATRLQVREIMLGERADDVLWNSGAAMVKATEIHHHSGRRGRLLAYEPLFVASCVGCREWPHTQLKEARELDFIAQRAKYDVFPEHE